MTLSSQFPAARPVRSRRRPERIGHGGVQALGAGATGIAVIGMSISLIWGWIAMRLGRQYDGAATRA